jgi:ABC-type transport system involved in multi-copper enzyme maturation permease subunit
MLTRIKAIAGITIKELYRRKDFYVLFIFTVLIALVFASMNFFNDGRIVRYLKEITLLLIWIASLAIAISAAARQIPAEKESRTIFPLLAKPITRTEFILGKFFGVWFACGIALLVFYGFLAILAGTREESWDLLNYFQAATLHWAMLGIVVAFVILGSLIFTAPSSNGTIAFILTAGVLLLARHLNSVALGLAEPGRSIVYALYYAIPHLEFFDMRDLLVHNWPLIAWGVWALALIYAAFYSAVFLISASLCFRRKALI